MSMYKPSGFFCQFITEIKKTRYRKIWLILLAVCSLQFLWSYWMLDRANPSELEQGYYRLLFDLPILNAIILPLLIAMIASRICDIEIKGNTLKLLYTFQKKGSIFDCKLLLGIMYLLSILVFQIILITVQGKFFHFDRNIPIKQMLFYFLSTFAVSAAILIIQQTLSLLFENQLVPLTAGLIGSFTGLFSMFFPSVVQKFFLWSYYSVFSTISSEWKKGENLHLYIVSFDTRFFIIFLIFSAFLYALGKYIFIRKEV